MADETCGAMSQHHELGPCVRPVGHLHRGDLHRQADGLAWGYDELLMLSAEETDHG
jgi:hypothetical protein